MGGGCIKTAARGGVNLKPLAQVQTAVGERGVGGRGSPTDRRPNLPPHGPATQQTVAVHAEHQPTTIAVLTACVLRPAGVRWGGHEAEACEHASTSPVRDAHCNTERRKKITENSQKKAHGARLCVQQYPFHTWVCVPETSHHLPNMPNTPLPNYARTSWNVVSMAAVFCADLRRSAMRMRMRVIFTRDSVRSPLAVGMMGGRATCQIG